MKRPSRQNQAVRDFILRNVASYPGTISARTIKQFGLSRTAVVRYMRRLIDEGLLTAQGRTNARRYYLKPLVSEVFTFDVSPGIAEDAIFRFRVLPKMKDVRQNIIDVCQYGFTEICNNVIDHSMSPTATVMYERNYARIRIVVADQGVGIFEKIQRDFNLPDPRMALLELSKGKITSDEARHSGQGIYFSSRMFDEFSIMSGNLFYGREKQDSDDWLIETHDVTDYQKGTSVHMVIKTDATWTPPEVFAKYQDNDFTFSRTHVPVKLGRYPGEQLVSRSQAKRVVARFSQFSEVILDFAGVPHIGQPFADEIFRVFASEHPQVSIRAVRTSPDVRRMIDYIQAPQGAVKRPA